MINTFTPPYTRQRDSYPEFHILPKTVTVSLQQAELAGYASRSARQCCPLLVTYELCTEAKSYHMARASENKRMFLKVQTCGQGTSG